ncbi:hypothetical protein [Flavobacterium sp.]|uniref:hypothetical protein n=1 Tax=Flavobacterium sp. TaxID=239 RepID=UPI0026348B2F|nr:hypothetical protein [Flavobacterium sp.]
MTKKHKTVFEAAFKLEDSDKVFNYQIELTKKLDNTNDLFNQDIINEIVLWKVNRFAKVDEDILKLLNSIDIDSNQLDELKTKEVLKKLLMIKGIQLPMASTILRFRNKNIYQIIDQRVYRIIYEDKTLELKTYPSEKNINEQIDIYLKYLSDLKEISNKLKIPFYDIDRILYKADKRINKDIPLKNY